MSVVRAKQNPPSQHLSWWVSFFCRYSFVVVYSRSDLPTSRIVVVARATAYPRVSFVVVCNYEHGLRAEPIIIPNIILPSPKKYLPSNKKMPTGYQIDNQAGCYYLTSVCAKTNFPHLHTSILPTNLTTRALKRFYKFISNLKLVLFSKINAWKRLKLAI